MRPTRISSDPVLPKLGRRWRLGLVAVGLVLTAAFGAAALSAPASSQAKSTAAPPAIAAEAGPDAVAPDASVDPDAPSHKARLAVFMQRVSAWRTVERLLHIAPPHAALARRGPAIRPGSTPLECMTQAIYYEARGEPEAGQTAVAQVVLNRSRLPQYPKSVCGVVFQGSTRPGCQFSFACEGGRQGGPVNPSAWTQAQVVAQKALSGATEGATSATHYHTGAVAPLWDRTMLKLAQIGHHIFFGSGQPAAAAQPPSADASPTAPPTAAPAMSGMASR